MNTTADQKLSFQCTACGKKLSVAPSARGKVVACPCGQKLKIPSLPQPAPASIFDSDLPEAISPTPQATNAYASPAAAPARHAKSSGSSDVNTVKSGQKLLIYSILGSLCSLPIISLANLLLGGTPEKPELTLGFALVLCFGILAMLAAAVCASLSISEHLPYGTRVVPRLNALHLRHGCAYPNSTFELANHVCRQLQGN